MGKFDLGAQLLPNALLDQLFEVFDPVNDLASDGLSLLILLLSLVNCVISVNICLDQLLLAHLRTSILV